MSPSPETIEASPAPWTLKANIWSLPIYVTSKMAATLSSDKDFLYSELEAESSSSSGKFIGGLSMVQIVRYTESPAGPYDEMILMPGYYEYAAETKKHDETTQTTTKKNLRVTKIFVSQKTTCWNGRKNWNIPKHLAKFNFQDLPDGSTYISVYPMEVDDEALESRPSKEAFFAATYKRTSYLPAFPMSTSIVKYLGIDLSFVQPPLPEGKGAQGELPGTDQWCQVLFTERSPKTSLGWWDLKQSEATEQDALLSRLDLDGGAKVAADYEHWWPELGRWRLGMLMENATVDCPEGRHWRPHAE